MGRMNRIINFHKQYVSHNFVLAVKSYQDALTGKLSNPSHMSTELSVQIDAD